MTTPSIEDEEILRQYLEKEIDVIQNIISRLAHHSFLVKGWAMTLIVVTLLFKSTDEIIFVAFIPLITFWYLDAYFLQQERLYRELYKWVIKNRLKTSEHLFDMNAYRFSENVQSKIRIVFSITLFTFYGSITLLLLIFIIYSFII